MELEPQLSRGAVSETLCFGPVPPKLADSLWSTSITECRGKQEIIDGIRRKSELIFNVTKATLPDAKVIYYDYGA